MHKRPTALECLHALVLGLDLARRHELARELERAASHLTALADRRAAEERAAKYWCASMGREYVPTEPKWAGRCSCGAGVLELTREVAVCAPCLREQAQRVRAGEVAA